MAEHRFVTTPATAPPSPGRPTGRSSGRGTDRTVAPPIGATTAGAIVVRPWLDPSIDRCGHDPRSRYVERFWLGVLGPSATWLLRRFQDELDAGDHRDGSQQAVRVDLTALARQMGMSYVPGRESAFSRAIQRCVMFGVAHHTPDGLAVRRRVPRVAERHLRRLPPDVAIAHDRWVDAVPVLEMLGRARRLAGAMAAAGDCLDQIEGQLVAVGVDPATADRAVDELRQPGSDRPGAFS